MISELVAIVITLSAVSIFAVLIGRLHHLPPLARWAIVGCGCGLLQTSRYVGVDHSVQGVIVSLATAALLTSVAVRHFKAYPPAV
jgi:hypothetical protein